MCSTCDYKNYTENNGRLEYCLNGDLIICCNSNGKNYKLAVKDNSKSEYIIYKCPTCGNKLF